MYKRFITCLLMGISCFAVSSVATPAQKPAVSKATKAIFRPAYDSVPKEFKTVVAPGIFFGKFTRGDGPFLLAGSIIVPAGQTLEFAPGTIVYIGGSYTTITVFGTILAQGTVDAPIVFRSANPRPNPWDWDRLYCRSKNRSVFDYCIIRNAIYGIVVENGAATITNSTFEQNSWSGAAAINSDVSFVNSIFKRGHVTALLIEKGSRVTADSLLISGNITAIAVGDSASFTWTRGKVSDNGTGMAIAPTSQVSILAADVTRNRTGLLSTVPVAPALREMVYENDHDNTIGLRSDIDKKTKPPESVRSVLLPKSVAVLTLPDGYKPGFVASKAPVEQTVSFMGNVTTGFKLFMPTSLDPDTPQQKYPGVANDILSGVEPVLQVFTSGRRNATDINMSLDISGNEWINTPLHIKKNSMNLSLVQGEHKLLFGDFFESGSETSISGRKFTGMKYSGEFMPIGKGYKRLEFKLAGGQTEAPKDLGQHDPDLYNSSVDSGMSVRQQITYITGVAVKPTFNSVINVKGIIARDQFDQPLFVNPTLDPKSPLPIKSQSGHIDGSINLFDGKLTLLADVGMGTHDTLDSTRFAEASDVAWYNPQILEAMPKVFKSIPGTSNYAVSFGGRGTYKEYDLSLTTTQIAPHYYSAGNPYLERDRRIFDITGARQFSEALSANAEYTLETRNRSNVFDLIGRIESPQTKNTILLGGEYALGVKLPALSADYTIGIETSKKIGQPTLYETTYNTTWEGDTISLDTTLRHIFATINSTSGPSEAYNGLDLKNQAGIEIKQRFDNSVDYSFKYRLIRNVEMSKHPDPEDDRQDNQWQHQITTRVGFKVGKWLTNKTSIRLAFEDKVRDETHGFSYKFTENARCVIIPRKLTVNLIGEYGKRTDQKLVAETGLTETIPSRLYAIETEVKYTLNARLSAIANIKYENSTDENPGSRENYTVKIGGLNFTYLF